MRTNIRILKQSYKAQLREILDEIKFKPVETRIGKFENKFVWTESVKYIS